MRRALRDAYNQELGLLKERAAEFAGEYPGLADRLGGLLEENMDPAVAGLLEGSAFLSAQVKVKMDEEYQTFTRELLEQIFPDALAPTPSVMLVRAQAPADSPEIESGLSFTAGEYMDARFLDAQQRVSCRFALASPLTVWPIGVTQATYHASAGPISALGQEIAASTKAGLVVDVARLDNDGQPNPTETLNTLEMDSLTLNFTAPMDEAAILYEQIFCDCTRVSLRWLNAQGDPVFARLAPNQLHKIGFDEGEQLFPHQKRLFDGFARLREFFVFPRKFLGLRLTGLRDVLPHVRSNTVQLVFEFSSPRQRLAANLDPQDLAVNAAPAVNLFEEMSSHLHLDRKRHEYTITPNSSPITHYEVHHITEVWAHYTDRQSKSEVHPLYALPPEGRSARQALFYTTRRKPRRRTLAEQRNGIPRNLYRGTETLISLYEPPEQEPANRLQVKLLCSNRHLPEYLPIADSAESFHLCDDQTVALKCLAGPSPPRDSLADRETTANHRTTAGDTYWRLLSYLSLGTSGVQSPDGGMSAASLREMLSLFADLSDSVSEAQISGVRNLECTPVTRTIAAPDGYHTARGLLIRVTFDETEFESTGIVPLGAVLDHFFAEYAAVNSFTQTVIHSLQRGEITRFAPRSGTGPLL